MFCLDHIHIQSQFLSLEPHGDTQELGKVKDREVIGCVEFSLDAFLIAVIHDGAKGADQADGVRAGGGDIIQLLFCDR